MRKRVIILGSVVAAVLVLWTIGWFAVAGIVRDNVAALAQADGEASPQLTCGRLDVGGYPFRFDVTCSGATIVSGDTTVGVDDVRASVRVYQPFHVLVFARGPANITDAFTGTRRRLDWQMLEGSVRLTDWRIARASVVVDKPIWTDTLVGDVQLADAEHAEFHLVDVPAAHDAAAHAAALEAYATVAGLNAPALGIESGAGTLEAELTGVPDDVRALGDAEALQRWQAAGGQLRLTGLKGSDTDQSFEVTGTLALDSAGRPDGELAIASKGVVETLQGLVPPELQGLILGSPAADGSYRQTLTIKAGIVFSGLVPAGMLPPLW